MTGNMALTGLFEAGSAIYFEQKHIILLQQGKITVNSCTEK